MTQRDILQKILTQNQGFITNAEAKAAGILSFSLLSFARKEGLVRLAPGFYATTNWPQDDYFLLQYRYPQFIYSGESALYLWGLTDQIVSRKVVTGPNGYHPYRHKEKEIEVHFERNEAIYKVGTVSTTTIFGHTVQTYDPEKTLCDLIRRKDQIESEVFAKAFHLYQKRKDRDPQKLMRYAQQMGVAQEMSDIMAIIGEI
jgi:predicted transcriptional regulator of viral defense system